MSNNNGSNSELKIFIRLLVLLVLSSIFVIIVLLLTGCVSNDQQFNQEMQPTGTPYVHEFTDPQNLLETVSCDNYQVDTLGLNTDRIKEGNCAQVFEGELVDSNIWVPPGYMIVFVYTNSQSQNLQLRPTLKDNYEEMYINIRHMGMNIWNVTNDRNIDYNMDISNFYYIVLLDLTLPLEEPLNEVMANLNFDFIHWAWLYRAQWEVLLHIKTANIIILSIT